MNDIPLRFQWAASYIAPSSADKVLELGCGAGLLVAALAPSLVKGSITAIDQSAPMITKARKKNADYVISGKVNFEKVSVADFRPGQQFDKIIGFNLNVFTKAMSRELAIIAGLLRATGKLFVFHQAPYKIDEAAAAPIVTGLRENGFVPDTPELKEFGDEQVIVIRATKR